MPRESMKSKRERALVVCERIGEHYPDAQPALDFGGDPFRLTIAVLLSAQTTDAAVNKVTPVLWERYPTIEDLASADVRDVEEILRSIEDNLAPVSCIKDGSIQCDRAAACQTIPMWKELDEITNAYLQTVTLEDLLTGEKWKDC